MRRVRLIIISMLLICSIESFAFADSQFTDIKENVWYSEGVSYVCFLQEQFGENCRIKWRILHLQNGESCKQSPDWDDQSGNCRHNINFIYAM